MRPRDGYLPSTHKIRHSTPQAGRRSRQNLSVESAHAKDRASVADRHHVSSAAAPRLRARRQTADGLGPAPAKPAMFWIHAVTRRRPHEVDCARALRSSPDDGGEAASQSLSARRTAPAGGSRLPWRRRKGRRGIHNGRQIKPLGYPAAPFRRHSLTPRACLAEGEGFEPSIRFPVYTLSKRAPSAARPPLRHPPDVGSARTIVKVARLTTRSRPGSGAKVWRGAAILGPNRPRGPGMRRRARHKQ